MKKLSILLLLAIIVLACKTNPKKGEEQKTASIAPVSYAMLESAVIYEANIRQYSKEGTFEAFTKDIPQLKELGVKIIWLMPIFPISETKRKATGDKFVHELPKEEQVKYLGSYYAVSDFKKINPEFGTIDDFRKLLNTAHQNGMYVILDWVPNHTGWDHTWLTTNPEFYTKNAKGEITDPLNEDGTPVGWADVADLNYDNAGLRTAMVNDMLHWVENENIDGFRCDVAGSVPTSFWKEAIPQLRAKKKLFMLAEAWEPELLEGELFDMGYGWDRHHVMNHIAKGEKSASEWNKQYTKDTARYEKDDILMTFITNHDENSWSGTIKERMGAASEAFTALSYLAPGIPLIYSGQEYGLQHRLQFFEKDSIPKTKGNEWELLKKLGKLKNKNSALHGGKNPAKYLDIVTNNDAILAFSREKNGESIMYLANLSNKSQTFENTIEAIVTDYIKEKSIILQKGNMTFEPWEYMILIK